MKKVLVTGASGCIGRQAVPVLLARGWDVHCVGLEPSPPPEFAGVTWHIADLLAPGAPAQAVKEAGADALLHLAWFIAPGRWAVSPENLDWVTASLALVRAFHEGGGSRVVVSGSCLEYDWDYGLCGERRTPCRPHTLYGTCKDALHSLLEGFARQSGLSLGWARIFFLYGPHEHPDRLVASVIRSLVGGARAQCSHGRQVRDYLYAGDVADALVTLLESDVTGPVNIGSGEAITVRGLVEGAADLLGMRDRVDFGAIPAAATDKPMVVADIARLSNEVRWRPRYTLQDGLRETIAWWRQQLDAPQRECRPSTGDPLVGDSAAAGVRR